MSKTAKKILLATLLLGGGACTPLDLERKIGYSGIDMSPAPSSAPSGKKRQPFDGLAPGALSNSSGFDQRYVPSDIDFVEVSEKSAKIGPLELSVGSDHSTLGLKLPLLPMVEFPFRGYLESDRYTGDYLELRELSRDRWMVGNGFDRDDVYSQQEVPVSSVLGKLWDEFVWRTDYAKPVRAVAKEISSLSDGPTSFIFGEEVKSKFEIKSDPDIDRIGFIWKVIFSQRYGPHFVLELEHQTAITDREETATRISFGF